MGGLNEIIVTKAPRIKSGTWKALSVFSVSSNVKKKKVVKEHEK